MPSVEVAPRGSRPPIRVRPAPRCDPPYDDEVEPQAWATAHQLAFEFPPSPGPASPPTQASKRQQQPPRRARAGAPGDAKLAVRRFVQMCVEVLNGYRPAAHLRRLALPKEAAGVVAQAIAGTSRVAEMRRSAKSSDRHQRGAGPVGVIRLQLCEPRPGAVEAAVLLVTGDRTWAMALRLERHEESWWATTLHLI